MTTKPKIGVYVRVSTATKRKTTDKGKPERSEYRQTTKSQRHAIREWARANHVHESELKWYEDRRSGKSLKGRDALARLLQDVQDGRLDCVVVYDLSRLARNLADGIRVLADLSAKVRVVSVSENIDFGNSTGQLVAQILLAVYSFQRLAQNEKIRQGLAARKADGHVLGRPRNQERLDAIRAFYDANGAQETCNRFGFSRANLYRCLDKTKVDAA